MKRKLTRRAYRQSGFTLIEVLVALILLSIGMLGVASIQYNTSRFAQSAVARSQASNALMDIVEKMRTNRVVATTSTAYNVEFANTACTPPNLLLRYGATIGLNNATTGAGLAAAEVANLQSTLACLLPAGDVRIVRGFSAPANNLTNCAPPLAAAPNDVVTIIVRYDERKVQNIAQGPSSSQSQSALICFTEVYQL